MNKSGYFFIPIKNACIFRYMNITNTLRCYSKSDNEKMQDEEITD